MRIDQLVWALIRFNERLHAKHFVMNARGALSRREQQYQRAINAGRALQANVQMTKAGIFTVSKRASDRDHQGIHATRAPDHHCSPLCVGQVVGSNGREEYEVFADFAGESCSCGIDACIHNLTCSCPAFHHKYGH